MLDGPDEDHPQETRAHPDGESSLPTSANSIPLRSVNAAAAYIPFITDSRKKVKEEMEAMVLQGLTSLVGSIHCIFGHERPDVVGRISRCSHHHFRRLITFARYQHWWKVLYVI